MTLDEMREKLRELGIPHDGWKPTTSGDVKQPMLDRYIGLLTGVRDLLEHQVDQDKQDISKLHILKERMKHGGGI